MYFTGNTYETNIFRSSIRGILSQRSVCKAEGTSLSKISPHLTVVSERQYKNVYVTSNPYAFRQQFFLFRKKVATSL